MYVLASYLALVLLATPLHATILVFLLYAGLAVSVIGMLGTKEPTKISVSATAYPLALPLMLFAALRLIPFIRWGPAALGADMGAYYASFNACFAAVAACGKHPAALLGYPLYALGIGTHAILALFAVTASLCLFFGTYRLVKQEWGETPAFWSATAYAASLPQFLFYWSFFLNMALSAAFSLLCLYAYAEKKKCAGAYAALAGIIHPLPLVPLVAAIVLAGITAKEKRYSVAVAVTGMLGTCIFRWREFGGYAAYVGSYVRGTYAAPAEPLLAGHFVGFSFYHDALMLFYVPFALLVIAWRLQKGSLPAIGWYVLVNLGLISLNAAFHNRFIILFDIGCIALAGHALAAFMDTPKTVFGKHAARAAILCVALYSLYQALRMEPLVTDTEFRELLSLQNKYVGLPIFVNNPAYRQFVAGYAAHPVVFAPFTAEPWKHIGIPSLVYNARRSTPAHEDDPGFTRVSENVLEYSPRQPEKKL